MAASLNGKLYVLGGYDASLGGKASSRVFVFDGTRWKETVRMKRPRAAGAAVTSGQGIMIVGGIGDDRHIASAEIFDGLTWRSEASMPNPYDHVAAASETRGPVFVVGGRAAGKHFPTVQYFYGDKWDRLPDMHTARSGLGAGVIDGQLIVLGGEGPRIFPEVETFSVGRWRRLPDIGVPRHGIGVVVIGNVLYAMLGGVRVGLAPSAASEALTVRIKETSYPYPSPSVS
jgi:N-acetylneuraminic acid mutarotase